MIVKEFIVNSFIGTIRNLAVLNSFKRKWRVINKHNATVIGNMFPIECVEVGNCSYGVISVITSSNKMRVIIGDFVSIADEVTFVLEGEHYTDHISTFPFRVMLLHNAKFEAKSKGNIIIDDDVWIGFRSTIMSGVHVHQGAIIAAGAVVTHDVPPYSIVAGVPAKVIKYRFTPEIIEKLITVNYKELNKELVIKHEDDLYSPFIHEEQLAWIPKK